MNAILPELLSGIVSDVVILYSLSLLIQGLPVLRNKLVQNMADSVTFTGFKFLGRRDSFFTMLGLHKQHWLLAFQTRIFLVTLQAVVVYIYNVYFVLQAVALYDYQAQRSDELSFRQGEVITVLYKDSNQWWMGVLQTNNSQGFFPSNYIEEITPSKYASLLLWIRSVGLVAWVSSLQTCSYINVTSTRHQLDICVLTLSRMS